MKELSLYLLDIAQNSLTAGASRLDISMVEDREGLLTMCLADNGRGMSPQLLSSVTDPFTTTRTTRKVGLGIPLLRMAALQTGGALSIESCLGAGATLTVTFCRTHIDCPPMGDLPGALALLIQGAPEVCITLRRQTPRGAYTFTTDQVRDILGPRLSLAQPEICLWLKEYLCDLERTVLQE